MVVELPLNFVLSDEFSDQAAVWQHLLDRVAPVRDAGIPGWLGVTAGTQAETTAFLTAITEARG
jgi:histidinol-phosphate aminotransferase